MNWVQEDPKIYLSSQSV